MYVKVIKIIEIVFELRSDTHTQRGWLTTLNKNINAKCKVLVPFFMSWNKRSQICSICTKILFFKHVGHKLWAFVLYQDNPSTWQVWHIQKLIKLHDHYTGAPWAEDNRRSLKCAVLSHNTMLQMSQVEGACNWYADCRNVNQSCCQIIEC
jgi:hypothetical protein